MKDIIKKLVIIFILAIFCVPQAFALEKTYEVLTDSSPPFFITDGEYVQVFGSNGINTINVEPGGRVECVNFAGSNVININEETSDFTAYRSGATVYFE